MEFRGRENPFTVTQITNAAKETLEEAIGSVWIKGEVSNFSAPASGHIYFTLKDDTNQIRAAFFRGSSRAAASGLKDGREAVVYGRVSIYGKRSEYQVIAKEIEVMGEGSLLLKFEKLKKKLAEEGLFEESAKKPIPAFPGKIGIITSGTGAAIRDIINIISRRYRAAEVLIYPVMVQGDEAPAMIINALKELNESNEPDVIVLTRGGGSIEDLWAFNDEKLGREIYNSKIPVVSAVGHEIDFTIADFAADLRAPTPSAAAELVVPDTAEVLKGLTSLEYRLAASLTKSADMYTERLNNLEKSYGFKVPFDLYEDYSRNLDELSAGLKKAAINRADDAARDVETLSGKLSLLNPLNILKKGYSVVYDNKEKIIRDAGKTKKGEKIKIKFYKGERAAKIEK